MARRSFQTQVADVVAAHTPASPIGAELVRTYVGRIRSDGSPDTLRHEIGVLRDLCQMVEATPVPTLSVAALESLLQPPAETAARRERRAKAVRRLIRMLQDNGELPSSHDLRYDRKLYQLLAAAASHARDNLTRWCARRHGVSPYELYHEARRLQLLEEVLAAQPGLDDRAAVAVWLQTLVRPIVDCGCPPVTRHPDDGRICRSCGQDAAKPGVKTTPSPGERKQTALRSLAIKYLRQRHARLTPTRYA